MSLPIETSLDARDGGRIVVEALVPLLLVVRWAVRACGRRKRTKGSRHYASGLLVYWRLIDVLYYGDILIASASRIVFWICQAHVHTHVYTHF